MSRVALHFPRRFMHVDGLASPRLAFGKEEGGVHAIARLFRVGLQGEPSAGCTSQLGHPLLCGRGAPCLSALFCKMGTMQYASLGCCDDHTEQQ